jgi:hypothetical protein
LQTLDINLVHLEHGHHDPRDLQRPACALLPELPLA